MARDHHHQRRSSIGAEYPRLAHGRGELLFTWSEIENGYSHVRTPELLFRPVARTCRATLLGSPRESERLALHVPPPMYIYLSCDQRTDTT